MKNNIWACESTYLISYLNQVLNFKASDHKAFLDLDSLFAPKNILQIDGDTARISISGMLQNKEPSFIEKILGLDSTSYSSINEALNTVADMAGIKRLELMMNTPGGEVFGADEVAQNVASLTDKMDVVAINGGLIASAGYWIASQASVIQSTSPTNLTGSIGVVMTIVTKDLSDKTPGFIKAQIVSRNAKNKVPNIETPEGLAVRQDDTDAIERVFIQRVADGRGVSVDTVIADFGQGGVFVANDPGKDAKDAISQNMIDGLISMTGFSSENTINLEAKEMTQEILTVEGLSESHPALVAAIGASAKSDECKRIQACEALMSNFAASPVAVQSKIRAAIDADKFDTEITAEKLSMKLLSVVSGAQAEFVATQTAPAIAAAAIVEDITVEGADLDDAKTVAAQKSKKVVSGLAAALKNVPVKG